MELGLSFGVDIHQNWRLKVINIRPILPILMNSMWKKDAIRPNARLYVLKNVYYDFTDPPVLTALMRFIK